MIKKLLLLTVFILPLKVICQFNFDLSVGLNRSNFDLRQVSPNFKDTYHSYFKYINLINGGIEVSYEIVNILLVSGICISYRGSKNYAFPNPNRKFTNEIYTFIEIPILINYNLEKYKIHFGGGFNFNKRIGSNTIRYGEYNRPYGMDLKFQIRYFPINRFWINLSYTHGNIDKYLLNIEDTYMHKVFGFNIGYRILQLK